MGGKNAVIVMDDADLELAAEAIVWSAYGTTGQRCTACSRVLVHERVHDALSERCPSARADAQARRRARSRHRRRPADQRGPARDGRALRQDRPRSRAAGSRRAASARPRERCRRVTSTRPRCSSASRADARIAVEEIFGPVLAMVPVRSLEEAIEVNNALARTVSRPRSSPPTSIAPSRRCATSTPASST